MARVAMQPGGYPAVASLGPLRLAAPPRDGRRDQRPRIGTRHRLSQQGIGQPPVHLHLVAAYGDLRAMSLRYHLVVEDDERVLRHGREQYTQRNNAEGYVRQLG